MVFTLQVSNADLTPPLSPLNNRRNADEIGAFHVIRFAGLLIEIRVAGNAVLFGPRATTNGSIVGIGHRRKDGIHPLKETVLRHKPKRSHRARFKIIHAKTVVHAEDDALLSDKAHAYQPPRDPERVPLMKIVGRPSSAIIERQDVLLSRIVC